LHSQLSGRGEQGAQWDPLLNGGSGVFPWEILELLYANRCIFGNFRLKRDVFEVMIPYTRCDTIIAGGEGVFSRLTLDWICRWVEKMKNSTTLI